MKKIYHVLAGVLFVLLSGTASAQKLTFSYDLSGNQTERRWLCANCSTPGTVAVATEKIASIDDGELGNEIVTQRSLKVFPNPVGQTLNLQWKVPENLFINKVEIFNLTGVRVYSTVYGKDRKEDQVALSKVAPGAYTLVAHYSDGKTETIKLIKI